MKTGKCYDSPVGAVLADLLVGERTSHDLWENTGLIQGFQSLIQAVYKAIEKL